MDWYRIITIPLIGAFIGWITNLIAVKMLFRPRNPINLGICKIQGVFPKRQKEVAIKLGELVARELFSSKDIKRKIEEKFSEEEIMDNINEKISDFLQNKIPALFPLAVMFLTPAMLNTVREAINPEIKIFVKNIFDKLSDKLDETIDIEKTVKEKVEGFSSDKLEKITVSIMDKELKFVEYIGGVLGLLIGIIQLLVAKM